MSTTAFDPGTGYSVLERGWLLDALANARASGRVTFARPGRYCHRHLVCIPPPPLRGASERTRPSEPSGKTVSCWGVRWSCPGHQHLDKRRRLWRGSRRRGAGAGMSHASDAESPRPLVPVSPPRRPSMLWSSGPFRLFRRDAMRVAIWRRSAEREFVQGGRGVPAPRPLDRKTVKGTSDQLPIVATFDSSAHVRSLGRIARG